MIFLLSLVQILEVFSYGELVNIFRIRKEGGREEDDSGKPKRKRLI